MAKYTLGKLSFEMVGNERALYRIIPHVSTLNSQNRRLWHTLHEIMAIYDSPISRLSRDGWRFTYRLKDDIWWVVILRAHNDGSPEPRLCRQIEFYICLPKGFAEVFTLKLKSHEQWRHCQVDEVPLADIEFPLHDLDSYQLRYTRANMFSVSHDYTRQLTPIREVLHVSQEMQADDFVGIFTRMETVSRKKWKELADYAWGIWDSGGIPSKNGFNPKVLMGALRGLVLGVVGEVKHIVDSTFAAIENSVFSGKNSNPDRLIVSTVEPERAELLVNGSLSTATRNKRNLPVFATSTNIMVHASTAARRDVLAHSVLSAFSDLAGDQRFELSRGKTREGKAVKGLAPPNGRHLDNYMSVDEVGKVIQLPTAEVLEEFKDEIQSNRNVEVDIPKIFLNDKGIHMGTAQRRGKKFDIFVPKDSPDRLMATRVFIGSQGMGKDHAIINLVVESKRNHGIGAVIVDVVDERNVGRGMSDTIRDHLPAESVIDIDIGEFNYPPYIGLAGALENPENERIAISRITNELVQFVMGDDFENYQTREYLREISKAVSGDLILIKRMMTDSQFRQHVIAKLKAEGKDATLLENYHNMGSSRNVSGPIFVRLGELTGDEILRPIFCQNPNPAIKFKQWLQDGKVIIYRVPKKDMTDSTVRTLCYWLVLSTYLTKLSLGGRGAMTWLVLNEPHQFLTKPLVNCFERILLEGRKWRLAPIFAFHDFEIFRAHPGFVDILKASATNWHLFKSTNLSMYQKIKAYLEPTFTPELAMSATKQFHYIAKWLDEDGVYQPAFMVSAPSMVSARYPTQENEFLTKRHSRMYGRHIDEVEKQIQHKLHKPTP